MLGEDLKASIQVAFLAHTSTNFYFPLGTWCQILPTIDPSKCHKVDANGSHVLYRTLLSDYQVHIRSGSVVPF